MAKTLEDIYSQEQSSEAGEHEQVTQQEAQPVEPAAEAVPENPAAPPADGDDIPDGHVPRQALMDERKKRQTVQASMDALQRRLDEIERRVSPQAQPERTGSPDPVIDPEGFQLELDRRRFEDRLEITTETVKEREGTEAFEAAEQAVLRLASVNEEFARQFGMEAARHRNPGRYTFEVGQQILSQMDEASPDKVRDRNKNQLRELLTELGLQLPDQGIQAAQPRVPTSLAGVQSVGPRSGGNRPVKRRSLDEIYR